MTHLTVRNIPPELAKALQQEKTRRGTSLNQTVIELLCAELGCRRLGPRRNGLKRLSGTWGQEEFEQFERAIAVCEEIDEELWR